MIRRADHQADEQRRLEELLRQNLELLCEEAPRRLPWPVRLTVQEILDAAGNAGLRAALLAHTSSHPALSVESTDRSDEIGMLLKAAAHLHNAAQQLIATVGNADRTAPRPALQLVVGGGEPDYPWSR